MYQHVVNFIVDIIPCILMLIPTLTFIDFLSTSLSRKMQCYHRSEILIFKAIPLYL